jgi:hypothetical protein
MTRWLAVLWLCASACDYVFVIEPDPTAVCGPYGEPKPLTFDASLELPQFFSARSVARPGDPVYGTVYAKRSGVSRVFIVQQTDDTTWTLAPGSRNSGLLDNTAGGSLGEIEFPVGAMPGIDRLVVWRGIPMRPFEAQLITQGYAIDNQPMVVDTEFDIMVGNLVEVLDTNPNTGEQTPQRKRAVITKVPLNGIGKPALVFADRIAPYDQQHLWAEDANRTMPINKDMKAVPGRGVLTADTFILVYSVKYANGSYDIYASRRDDTTKQWNVGSPVGGRVNTKTGDEVDPWINGDCSTLYFSRAGTIYRADRVDE